MLSRSPQRQEPSSIKMYGHLLNPRVRVQSTKIPSDKASLRCDELGDNVSRAVHTGKGCSDLTSGSIGYQKSRFNGSELLAAGSGSKQEFCNLTMPGLRKLCWKNRSWSGNGMLPFFALSLLLVVATCQAALDGCAPGIKTAGRTWPAGDIVLEDGHPLEIYCILDETAMEPKYNGKNASDLVFFRNGKMIEPEFTSIINSTTIALRVPKLPPSADWYFCKVGLDEGNGMTRYEVVCHNKIVVGFKPIKPENFTCVSRNWENLICSWDPVPNNVTTNFTLHFFFPGRAGGRALYSCPQPKEDQPPNTCMLDSTTDTIYRPSQANYYFTLNVSNYFGEKSFSYQFNHWAHVIPSQPVGLKVVNKTFSSALLYWKIPYPLESFPPGLHSKVSYQCLHDQTKTWENIDITDEVRASERYFNLTNLQYANAPYDVRVFLKSAVAMDENHWSLFSSCTFKTAATLPGQSPKTDIGSFQVEANSSKRDVYIYWQTIPSSLENGDNFTYQVVSVEENGKTLDVTPSEKTKSYAKFRGMSHERLKFVIVTANVIGANETRAVVHVPSHADMLPEPAAFTKIAFDNGTHELSWNPSSTAEITNYTIFWCENVRERPYQCKGYLDWVHVSSNTSAYNITVPAQKNYQFAIAANTKRASSGMTWAACTAIHNKFVGKMNSMGISDTESDRINVTWRLECSDRIDSIEGFVIYYCPILLPQNDSCKTPEMVEFVPGGPHTSGGQLVRLKPYTTYSIRIAVKTKNGEGPKNEPLRSTTLEGAPTPPRDIKIKNVTNTSMVVEWNPPEAENGVVRYYTVHYGDKVTKVEQPTGQKITIVQIEDLQPYKNYTVTVSAQTVKEGNRSESKTQVTNIGLPGKIDIPKVHFSNATQVQIQWDPPKEAGGELDYYEIKTTDGTIHSNITTREKYLDISRCEEIGRETAYLFQVRAVNLGMRSEIFQGPWSDPGETNCFNIGPSNTVWVVIWIIGCLSGVAFVMFLGYSSKRLWIKCKAMQDVEVKLPPGLQPNSKLLEKGNEQRTKQPSADSSGCSSGQESVTSSLTDSHVSTDSGADLDPVPMSPTKLLEPPPTWESSSNLRQRNVTGTAKPEFSGERGLWDPYVKVAKTMDAPTGDCLSLARSTPNLTADETVAVAAATPCPTSQPHNWSSTGYISMPSSEDDFSNNPSPLLRGKGSTRGVYSVVGLAPTPTPPKRGIERSQPRTGDLIPIGVNPRKEPVAPNPYVSLASLEQTSRNASDPRLHSVGDFADLDFVHSVRENQPQQQPPYSISDKISKPYVQAGLIDAIKISGRTPEMSGGRPPFAPRNSSHSLIEIPANSYVPVDTARGPKVAATNKDSAHDQNPYVAVSTLATSSESPSLEHRQSGVKTDDHLGPPYSLSLQQTETNKTARGSETTNRSAATPLPVVKQTSGYVTIVENPTSSTVPYAQHQQGDKKSPPSYQQQDGPADERYSKVSVVPTTT